jgi:putative ABC transport system permease protein
MVLRESLRTAGLGIVTGVPVALALSQLTRSLLFGVSSTSPHVFLVASVALCSIAIAASLIPAVRAGRTDPVVVIRGH